MRERLKTILCIVLSLTAAVGLMLVRDSAAWLKTGSGEALAQSLATKKFAFTFTGSVHSYLAYTDQNHTPFIITDRNLVHGSAGAEDDDQTVSLCGSNTSMIATDVRFKVFYSSPLNGQLTEYAGANGILQVEAASGWTFNSTTHYFTRSFSATNGTTPTNFDLLYSISFDDSALEAAGATNSTSLSSGWIMVAIQARQHDFMTWADIGEISSTTSAFVSNAMTTTQA